MSIRQLSPRLRCQHTLPARRCLQPQSRRWQSSAAPKRPRTAIFFPGQGVQRVGMIDPWLDAFPRTVKPIIETIDEILKLDFPLTRIISEGTNSQLTATENSQPAIMATSVIVLRVLEREFGFKTAERVDFTLGHSLGEFAATVAGGYMHFDDSLRMVRRRGEVMGQCSREVRENFGGEVGMVALVLDHESRMADMIKSIYEFLELSSESKNDSAEEPALQQVSIANINSKNQIVLSGSIEKINTLLTNLRQFGGHDPRAVRLKSDSPFHSPLMKPAQDLMKKILYNTTRPDGSDIVTYPGYFPLISNVSARPVKSRDHLKELLARQCVETVQWWDSVKYLHKEEKVKRWIGIGPGKVGRNLVGKEVGMKGAVKGGGVWGITTPKEAEECMKGLQDTESIVEDEE